MTFFSFSSVGATHGANTSTSVSTGVETSEYVGEKGEEVRAGVLFVEEKGVRETTRRKMREVLLFDNGEGESQRAFEA